MGCGKYALILAKNLFITSFSMENDMFVLSPGSEVIKYSLKDRQLEGLGSLLPHDKWDSAYWPTYDRERKLIYFEAININISLLPNIFSINIANNKDCPVKIVEGRKPSISPTGDFLAYYQHPYELWVLEINSGSKKNIVRDISNDQPVVWISEHDLLYTNSRNELIRLDTVSGSTKFTGYKSVIPAEISPDGNSVLCGSYDGSKIFIYAIKTNKITVIKRTYIFSMGSSLVWSHNGQSFLYTRQVLSNLIKFDENRSLFLFSLEEGKEIKLSDKYSLFGGVSVNDQ